ncbi:MAG: hypothetical protein PHU99_09915 [Candidatus Cloacimonetes bacterium]|nr:hypothetical protein [Candidatus Cloacimonadota bacterium]
MKSMIICLLGLALLLPVLATTQSNDKELNMNKVHQQLAIDLFNQSWDILLKEDRNRKDEDLLLNMVHASLYHWRQVGQPINILRGEWMLAHVYTLLGHKEAALYHAENVMTLKDEIQPRDWDLAYCYEAMARVMALYADQVAFDKYHEQALKAGKEIADEGARKQFDSDMNDDFWFGMKPGK